MKFYSTITSRGPSTVITSHYRIPLLLLFASLFLSTNAQTTTTPSDSNSDPNSTVDNSGDDSATSGPDANGVCYKDPPTNQDVVPCAVRTHNTASGVNVVPIVIGVVAGCVVGKFGIRKLVLVLRRVSHPSCHTSNIFQLFLLSCQLSDVFI
ncbi:hypothetical protein K435DRAFT_506462 [Dendrothele bispora CBS 962.96]|uniref:Hydrophobin n=1 Tax=Dendrothele bispora (strain CBS 962.96) TaxID=1314807 RepID=A0A4S8MT42_DENBC|nr:hypothetical protein K435DRAFT_506462 [Dendrothele bispora CBS 962.96]